MPKNIVILISVLVIALSVLSWLPAPEAKDLIRTSMNVVLVLFLYRGANWARWVVGILCGLASVTGIYLLTATGNDSSQMILLWIMTGIYAGISVILLSGAFVGPHFKARDS
ncbi:MAG: hypothetical protein AAF270_12990 [Pseudomonadota bacterium]